MTLPPRRTPAALLQVDAILGRLDGVPALDEVTRYLVAEFPELAAISFFRAVAPALTFAGGTPIEGRGPDEVPPAVDEAFRMAHRVDDPATREVAVPIRDGEVTTGVLLARPAGAPLDGVDGRFLGEVARRTSRALGAETRRLL